MKRTPLLRKAPLRRSTGVATASVTVIRPRRCKACKEQFTPQRPMQRACSPDCALQLAQDQRAKDERAADRVKREKLKTRSDWIKDAQVAFNRYVRLRDAGRPCICCGRTADGWTRGGEWDAGHYRSRGAAPHLRFDERNVHAQLKQCNRHAAGNIAGYRKGLLERIGLAALEALESDETPRRYTVDDLRQIRDKYRRLARELEKQ